MFAVLVVGVMASGLGLATYAVSEASELVFGPATATTLAPAARHCTAS